MNTRAKAGLLTMVVSVMLMGGSVGMLTASASGLDGVGTEVTETVPSVPDSSTDEGYKLSDEERSNAEAIGGMFKTVGVDKEATEKANKYLAPVAKWVNVGFAIAVGLAGLFIFLLTGLDLLYIAAPPVRGFLYPGGEAAASAGGGGGYGGGGYGGGGYGGGGYGGGGYGGGGYGGGGGGQQQGGMSAFLSRWISDEAVAATASMTGGQQGGGGGGGYGGYGGGGYGGGQPQQPMKSVLFAYMKKRIFFVISFFICVIMFSSSVFTDLGVKLGIILLEKLTGLTQGL